MRLKNIRGALERVLESPYVIKKQISYLSQKELFDNDNPIYLELGMGKGDFIIANALKYPKINFIGVEKYSSVLLRAIQKIGEQKIPNLKLINIDATEIDKVFNKKIDLIYLNFSDPWPKEKHSKRRLTSPIFLQKYDYIFKDKKEIVMKTDNAQLFAYSLMSFNNYGYKFEYLSLDLYQDKPKDNIMTEYEQKFVKEGKKIYKVVVNK